ncbi:PAK-box/P21-Rho-binding [Artemisia annua]|uniref:PAK-box/P21-Rho-binding n=1 Tax=Artemisia annua TaxID=35608 RepID=A0A2U1Q6L2_ARTAN|nr:PAK-box/P21-Rho-binding [Artemisia annua]
MKETNSRLIVLPFCLGCLSQSTTKSESNKVAANMVLDVEKSSMVKIKKSWSYVAPNRSNISKAMEKLIKVTLKSFANVFAYKGFEDIEIETELEIGYPTDVKHVTHIGYDGSTTRNPDKILDHLQPLATTLPLPSVSETI